MELYGVRLDTNMKNSTIAIADFLKGVWFLADKKTKNNRIYICLNCDKLNTTTRQCEVCGCFILVKIQFKKSKCPESKWAE